MQYSSHQQYGQITQYSLQPSQILDYRALPHSHQPRLLQPSAHPTSPLHVSQLHPSRHSSPMTQSQPPRSHSSKPREDITQAQTIRQEMNPQGSLDSSQPRMLPRSQHYVLQHQAPPPHPMYQHQPYYSYQVPYGFRSAMAHPGAAAYSYPSHPPCAYPSPQPPPQLRPQPQSQPQPTQGSPSLHQLQHFDAVKPM